MAAAYPSLLGSVEYIALRVPAWMISRWDTADAEIKVPRSQNKKSE